MSIENTEEEEIKIREAKIAIKKKEIEELEEQIEQIKKDPKRFYSLEVIMQETKQALEESNSPQMRTRYLALKNLMRAVGMSSKYETLFEVSMSSESEIMRRAGLGEKKFQELKNLLAEYGLNLVEG